MSVPHISLSQQSVDKLGTFARLPPEVRRDILIAAFGERKLHLDHLFGKFLSTPTSTEFNQHDEHGSEPSPSLSGNYFQGCNATVSWYWRVWECNRNPLDSFFRAPPRAAADSTYSHRHRAPWCNDCRSGEGTWRRHIRPMDRAKAQRDCLYYHGGIGAIGWLLTCRQAYAEGIDVLCSTNTFIINCPELLDAVLQCPGPDRQPKRNEDFIFPERLTFITSLELRWAHHDHRAPPKTRQLETQMASIPSSFPNLRRLVLSFPSHPLHFAASRSAEWPPDVDLRFLQPLAETLSRLPKLCALNQKRYGVTVELPLSLFTNIKNRTDLALETELMATDERGGGKTSVWLKYPVPLPAPSLVDERKAGGGNSSTCYYIKEGFDDGDVNYKDDSGFELLRLSEIPIIFYHLVNTSRFV